MSAWNRNAHKFGAKRVSHDGYSFASKLESALYDQLKIEMIAGIWSDIHPQVQIHLTDAAIIYKPDFKTVDAKTGESIFHEAKGYETPEWRIKRRLWMHYGPGELRVYKGVASRIKLHETIRPKGNT